VEGCRPATTDDLGHILALAARLRDELKAMRGGELWLGREARPEPLEEQYRALLDRDDALVIVGTIDDTPVGFGTVEVETLRTGERLGVIDELYVEEDARSVGVGESMAAALLDFCRQRKCCGVDTRALPGHRAAKNFFEEQGFTARALVMHRPLDEA
jgi:GNAT superfamily N-acetyltransferase